MYERDMPAMRAHAVASPDGLVDVITFVLLTIQQQIIAVPAQMQDVREVGEESRFLFGSKRDGYRYARDHADYLWRVWQDIDARRPSAERKADLIEFFLQVPGLGIPKAAFLVQCLGGQTACLDSHNLTRLGLPESAFKLSKGLRPETVRRKVRDYIRVCHRGGRSSAYWWNSWCQYVAGRRNSLTADQISAIHQEALA